MYARLIMADLPPEQVEQFFSDFGEQRLPALSRTRGFKALYLLRGAATQRLAALVLWETQADAVAMPALPEGEVMEVVLRA